MYQSPHPACHVQIDVCPVCKRDGTECPRCQAYNRLPKLRCLQAFLSFVMGVPHVGQKPFFKNTAKSYVVSTFACLLASIIANICLITAFSNTNWCGRILLALPILASCLTTSGILRSLHHGVLHLASHNAYDKHSTGVSEVSTATTRDGVTQSKQGKHSQKIGEIASVVALTLPNQTYFDEHGVHHGDLTGEHDPDQHCIASLGFVPGRSVGYYRRQLLIVLLPKHLLRHLYGRLVINFGGNQPFKRKITVLIIHLLPIVAATVLTAVYSSPLPLVAWFVAGLLPLTVGYYVSLIFYSIGLHLWFYQPAHRNRDGHFEKTGARFVGSHCPSPALPRLHLCTAWIWWGVRLFAFHLLIERLFVLGLADTGSGHQPHHADPNGKTYDHFNAAYSRHELAQHSPDAARMWHTWGIYRSILGTFQRMSKMAPIEAHENDCSFLWE